METIADYLVDLGMIFGPTVGYVAQYKMIRENNSIGSFSIDVPLILISCNILRIVFWFGKQFEFTLLLQSFVMIACQLIVLKECVRVQSGMITHVNKKKRRFWEGNFWRWDEYRSYVEAVVAFAGLSLLIGLMFVRSWFFVEFLGMASVSIEVCLAVPQILRNHRTKSTQGLSLGLIMTWFVGDGLKTLYMVMKHQPFQFILCGMIQITLDTIVLIQMRCYKKKSPVML